MTKDPRSDTEQMFEELSAYLDGELPPDAVRRVEERLARDMTYQAELQRLERAWRLLDRLPTAVVSDAFTQSTIEMVAVAADREAEAVEQSAPRDRLQSRLLGTLGLLAAGLVGFAVGHRAWPNPNLQLLKDLPVLEHFEFYYQADDLDFLRLLEREKMFLEGDGDHAN